MTKNGQLDQKAQAKATQPSIKTGHALPPPTAGGTARHEHSALHYRGTACLQAAAQPSAVRIRSCAALPCPAPTMPPPPPSAPASHHLRLWWRRRGRAGAVGATFAVALLATALLLALSSYASIVFPASSGRRGPALVGLTLVRRASEKGAREFPAHNTSLLSILNFKFRTAVRPFVLAHVRCPEYFPTRNRPRDLSRVSALVFAVCLDGSAPGYHLQGGSGSGSRSWLIHLEVGDVPDRYHVSIRARAPWVSKLV
jgi:hypothetical protein